MIDSLSDPASTSDGKAWMPRIDKPFDAPDREAQARKTQTMRAESGPPDGPGRACGALEFFFEVPFSEGFSLLRSAGPAVHTPAPLQFGTLAGDIASGYV